MALDDLSATTRIVGTREAQLMARHYFANTSPVERQWLSDNSQLEAKCRAF